MTALELVIWLTLVEAIMGIARELLPEQWLRYCQITGELERVPRDDAAGRARLAKSHDLKIHAAADWDALGAALLPGYRSPYRTPELTRATALAGEAFLLEKQFEAALVQKLGAELWEIEAVDDRKPFTAGKVHPTNWTGPADKIVFHYDLNAIEIEPGNWLRRVRLRPARGERSNLPSKTAKEVIPAEAGGAARKPRRGPVPGRTNSVERQRQALVPRLDEGWREGETYEGAIERMASEGVISLPGRGSYEHKVKALARVWGAAKR